MKYRAIKNFFATVVPKRNYVRPVKYLIGVFIFFAGCDQILKMSTLLSENQSFERDTL